MKTDEAKARVTPQNLLPLIRDTGFECGDGTCGCGCGLPLTKDGICTCGCGRPDKH